MGSQAAPGEPQGSAKTPAILQRASAIFGYPGLSPGVALRRWVRLFWGELVTLRGHRVRGIWRGGCFRARGGGGKRQ